MINDLELRHIRYFLAVAEERHFGRAAEALGVTQPVVSRQVRALEHLLGVTLLKSTRPTVELTEEGKLLLERAPLLLQELEELSRTVKELRSGKKTLAIAFEPCSAFHRFRPVMDKLARGMSDIQIQVYELPISEHAFRLRSGEIDLSFGHRGSQVDNIVFLLLASEPLKIGVASTHPLAKRRTIDVAELLGEPFVFWHKSLAPACHEAIVNAIHTPAGSPEIRHLAPDHLKLLEMVAAGLGWTVAPACVDRARFPGVVFRSLRGIDVKIDVGIAYLIRRAESLKPVIDMLSDVTTRHPL